MTKRHVSLPPAAGEGLGQFLDEVDRRLSSDEDTCDVVEDVLVDLHGDREAYERWQSGGDVSPAERVRLQGYDPCNSTLENEYYAEVAAMDEGRFEYSKYLSGSGASSTRRRRPTASSSHSAFAGCRPITSSSLSETIAGF
jgi:hypothetical protein